MLDVLEDLTIAAGWIVDVIDVVDLLSPARDRKPDESAMLAEDHSSDVRSPPAAEPRRPESQVQGGMPIRSMVRTSAATSISRPGR